MFTPTTSRVPSLTGSRPTAARPSVVLPDPDSPTSPTVSPGYTSNVMPSAARKAGTRPRFGYSMATSRKLSAGVAVASCAARGAVGGSLAVSSRGTAAKSDFV
ncbi:unannotated protein [freshwater metagenome]|uniref:Unannotated protein n=1 Tax=freshwater metagenome TaxID=449393 RepID=A0A6J7F997_9ZZZZ